jgi:hypothetical protein
MLIGIYVSTTIVNKFYIQLFPHDMPIYPDYNKDAFNRDVHVFHTLFYTFLFTQCLTYLKSTQNTGQYIPKTQKRTSKRAFKRKY